MLSSLLATSTVGMPLPSNASTRASAGVKLPASTTNRIRSTSATAPCTVLFNDLLSALACSVWKPGVSTKTNCTGPRVRMPVMRCRVVCALREVMLIFWPTSAFSSVDLPTLGLPTMAIVPQRCGPVSSTVSGGASRSAMLDTSVFAALAAFEVLAPRSGRGLSASSSGALSVSSWRSGEGGVLPSVASWREVI